MRFQQRQSGGMAASRRDIDIEGNVRPKRQRRLCVNSFSRSLRKDILGSDVSFILGIGSATSGK
jgi:hypothetical protein